MAHFYADIQGSAQTEATRIGNKHSGISGHIRGWESGVKVTGRHLENGEVGNDRPKNIFDVSVTHGSNGYGSGVDVLSVAETGTGNLNVVVRIPRNATVKTEKVMADGTRYIEFEVS